ncbi:MAG TPA: tRNA (guanosine(37)-N1)-methyltransferase TrmD [Thermomicrobiales bacterium]|nr:tRNA (guanosine(37)-N1)-methyltransferase TrmD [Thermomicrobiales bacterium]
MITIGPMACPGPRRVDVFTLFPAFFESPLRESIIGRALSKGLIDVRVHDLRDWTTDRHRSADDTPYGGGAGMVLMAPPIVDAVEQTIGGQRAAAHVVFLSASGRPFTQALARELAELPRLALVCGHYEGIDQRAVDILQGDEISIGDYILTGGEIPALVVIDAVTRLIAGVIDEASITDESYESGLLEHPQYTRPASFRGHDVPPTLLSGNHAKIERWRREQALMRTAERRPDLLQRAALTPDDHRVVDSLSSRRDRLPLGTSESDDDAAPE